MFSRLFTISVFFTIVFSLIACGSGPRLDRSSTEGVRSLNAQQKSELNKEEGFLLISVDSELQVRNFEITGKKDFRIHNLSNFQGSSYFIAAVPAGQYRIKNIHFGVLNSYMFDEEDGLWSFKVKSGVVSYVGEMKIRKISDRRSSFELSNNSSSALEFLEQRHPDILSKRKVKYYGPGADSFFQIVR